MFKKAWRWIWYWFLDPKGIKDKELMHRTRDRVQTGIITKTKDIADSKRGAGWRLLDRIRGKEVKQPNRTERRAKERTTRKGKK